MSEQKPRLSDASDSGLVLGLEVESLPENWTPLEAVAVVKALDADGVLRLLVRPTRGVTAWEAVGMLTVAVDGQRADIIESLEDGE